AEVFGTRDYGRIYSTSQLVTTLGVAGCPALIGLMFETSGGYGVPFVGAAALTMIGLVILALFATPRRWAASRSRHLVEPGAGWWCRQTCAAQHSHLCWGRSLFFLR